MNAARPSPLPAQSVKPALDKCAAICQALPMTTRDLDSEIQEAKIDLAFALAQGDGYAEDEAAARIAELTREQEAELARTA